jgi:hypothetical protein
MSIEPGSAGSNQHANEAGYGVIARAFGQAAGLG